MTAYPASRKCSADVAPRVPEEKLSINRTVLCSSGTVVPPEVTRAMRRGVGEERWCEIKDDARVVWMERSAGGGLDEK